MKFKISNVLMILTLMCGHTFIKAQNVAINIDGSAPDPKAMLDVKSNNKGMLIPRMTTAERDNIMNPPGGLMVYDTDIKSFFYHTGVNGIWKNMLANLELPYFDNENINAAAFHIQNAEPSPTAIAGQFTASDGIGVYGNSGNIGGKFFGTTGIDVVGGGGNGGYAGKFYSPGARGVYIDINGTGEALIVDRGKTGLGTVTPQAKLHVSGPASNGDNIFLSSALFYNPVDEMKLAHWVQQSVGGAPLDSYFGMRSNHRLNIVSNNNVANPEISLIDGKVGINKIDGTYPLSVNGKTAFYEDNTYVGTLYGQSNGNLFLNSNISTNYQSRKHLILQTTETANTYPGFVGINNTNPSAFLDVQKTNDINQTAAKLGTSTFSAGNHNITSIEGGTVGGSGVLSLNSDIKADVSIAGGGGDVHIAPTQDMSGDVFISSGYFNVPVEDLGTNGGNVFIAQSGGDVLLKNPNISLSIGTDNKDHKLNVNGTIRSTELIVQSGWADYVFDKDYSLMPVDDVEKFILKNKHLPNIPTATTIQNDGLKVSEVSTKMMEKIEEMMLYIIEQNKQIKALQNEVSLLKAQK